MKKKQELNSFFDRQNLRCEKIEEQIERYGSVDKIPKKDKDKIIEESLSDLPIINGIHITLLQRQIKSLKFEVAMLEFAMIVLGIFIIVNIMLK